MMPTIRYVALSRLLGALALCAATVPQTVVAAPEAAPAVFSEAHYEPSRLAIVVHFNGPAPHRAFALISPTRGYYDFSPAKILWSDVEFRRAGGVLRSFSLAQRPGGNSVRLAFTLTRRPHPACVIDPAAHTLRIYLLGLGARSQAALSPSLPLPPSGLQPTPGASASSPQLPAMPVVRPAQPSTGGTGWSTPLPIITPPSPSPTPRPTPQPQPLIATRLLAGWFDPARQALVLRYAGAQPAFTQHRDGAGHLTVSLFATAAAPAMPPGGAPHSALLNRWQIDPDVARGLVRVACSAPFLGDLVVAADPQHEQLLLFPQSLTAAELAPPPPHAAITTVFTRAHFDPAAGGLVIPYFGQRPQYTVGQASDTYRYINFLASALSPAGVQFDTVQENPLLSFWLLTKRSDRDTVRLGLALPYGGYVRVFDDPANHRMIVVPALGTRHN